MPMSPELIGARIREIAERAKRVHDSVEFRSAAARLAAEERDQRAVRAGVERLEYLVGSGIPRSFWDLLDSPRETQAITEIEMLLAEGPSLVVLSGPPGVGKSVALGVATWRARGRMLSTQDVFRVSSFAESEWRDLRTTHLLALDEAGAEHMTDHLRANLLSVISGRMDDGARTVIATNLAQAEFAERFFSGALSRLRDRFRAAARWAPLQGSSLRRHWAETDRDPGEEG